MKSQYLHFASLEAALKELCRDFAVPVPALEMSNRMTVAAGYWYMPQDKYPNGVIRLSKKNAEKFGYESILGTMKHEFAHHYLYFIHIEGGYSSQEAYAQTSHTKQFKEFCARIGGTMSSQMAGEEFKHVANDDFLDSGFKWTYRCSCGHGYRHTRRRLAERELKKYQCSNCKTKMPEWEYKAYAGNLS